MMLPLLILDPEDQNVKSLAVVLHSLFLTLRNPIVSRQDKSD
jgi:hypothetical protein